MKVAKTKTVRKLLSGLAQAVLYGTTIPAKVALIFAALLWALLTLFNPAPLYHSYEYYVAFIFTLDGGILLWRLLDPVTRVGWTRLVNAGTCGLWVSHVVATSFVLGFLSPRSAAECTLALIAAWVTLRSDLTTRDRASG